MDSSAFLRWRCQRRVRRILGPGARLRTAVELQRRPGARTVLIELSNSGARALLKIFSDEAEARIECENLEAIGSLESVHTPALLGLRGGALLRDYVEGSNLRHLQDELSEEEFEPHRRAVLENLVLIHAARNEVEKQLTLRRPFASDSLGAWIRRSLRKVEETGFALYGRHAGPVPAAWRDLNTDTLVGRLVDDLDTGRGPAVLGHGDYHLGNLVLSERGEIFTLDLEKLCLAPPWYDLAGTAIGVEGEDEDLRVARYLDAMQQAGHPLGVSLPEALRLARSGTLCRWLYYARMLTRTMKSGRDATRFEYFGRLMDAMTRLAA